MFTREDSLPAYKKLGEFNSITLNKTNETCLDYSYDKMIEDLRNVTWGNDEGMISDNLYFCTHFVSMFLTIPTDGMAALGIDWVA